MQNIEGLHAMLSCESKQKKKWQTWSSRIRGPFPSHQGTTCGKWQLGPYNNTIWCMRVNILLLGSQGIHYWGQFAIGFCEVNLFIAPHTMLQKLSKPWFDTVLSLSLLGAQPKCDKCFCGGLWQLKNHLYAVVLCVFFN